MIEASRPNTPGLRSDLSNALRALDRARAGRSQCRPAARAVLIAGDTAPVSPSDACEQGCWLSGGGVCQRSDDCGLELRLDWLGRRARSRVQRAQLLDQVGD